MRSNGAESGLPAAEAAVLLRISRERVIRLIQTGAIPGRKIPDVGWVVDRLALEHLIGDQAADGRESKARRAG